MKIAVAARFATLIVLLGSGSSAGPLLAQVPKEAATTGGPTIESINLIYERELMKLERQKLEHLGQLALSQPKDQSDVTFDAYFRLAIAKGLYVEADPIATRLIQGQGSSPGVSWLAHLVHIVAEADRGDYDKSLEAFTAAIRVKGRGPDQAEGGADGLPVGTKASIIDAYYQRLIHADQIEVARKAMKLIVDNSKIPAIRDLAAQHLKQLDLVGRIAPPIVGVDLDGKPYKLEDHKGEVVLVVFWASWCLPNAQEMPWLGYIDRTYKARGFRVVGINLDAPPESGQDLKTALPHIRRFLLDYNVTWPTLLNGTGELDYAGAFGVTEIPANVLIGRDGKVSHLDLTGKKLEKAIAEAVAQKP